jgi:hypothetical protein
MEKARGPRTATDPFIFKGPNSCLSEAADPRPLRGA